MNPRKIPTLSKSKYLAGLQCPLRLWHQCYNPDLASEISPVQQALFETGHEVGALATRLYAGGVHVQTDPLRHKEAVEATLRAMEDPGVPAIYEASFLYDSVRVKVDILARLDHDKWNLIEVKSSTRVKDEYLPDVAVQYHVLKGAGLDVDRVILMHLNNQYVYDGGELNLQGLFSSADLTAEALSYQAEIAPKLCELRDVLAGTDPPLIFPSRHCSSPHPCEFWEHCRRDMPEHWVMELAGIGQNKLDQLTSMNIRDIRDAPDSFPLSEIQERIRRCLKGNLEYISEELKGQLEAVEYPVHFVDFETLGLAIPRYPGTRPYQTIPFQWSDLILHEEGRMEHREYLCCVDKDPREEFALTLLDVVGRRGSIVTCTTYEEGVIRGLAGDLPMHRERLLATLDRLVDLYEIVRKQDNYL